MTEFLVELYIPRTTADAVGHAIDRARYGAAELTTEGASVRLLHSIFVPEDETCLLLFEAASIDAVRDAAHRAALPFEHIAETASDWSWGTGAEWTTPPERQATSDTTTTRPAPPGRATHRERKRS